MLSREGAVTGVTQSVTPAKRHTGMHCVVQGPVHEGARPDACCRARLERATPEVEGFSLPFLIAMDLSVLLRRWTARSLSHCLSGGNTPT